MSNSVQHVLCFVVSTFGLFCENVLSCMRCLSHYYTVFVPSCFFFGNFAPISQTLVAIAIVLRLEYCKRTETTAISGQSLLYAALFEKRRNTLSYTLCDIKDRGTSLTSRPPQFVSQSDPEVPQFSTSRTLQIILASMID